MRPWELTRVPGIDVMDAVGSNIRLDVRQRQVMRILPRINEDVNEEWISDKTRHHVDALVRNRLDRPWVREKGKLREASWQEALEIFAERLKKAGRKVAAIAGDLLDAETMYAAKKLLEGQGSNLLEGRQTGLDLRHESSLSAVAFNSTIAGIETADAVLLVGSNIRWEAPLIATRVRKVARKGGKVFAIGPEVDLGMKVEWLGDDLKLLGKLPKAVTEAFAAAERPAVIVGPGALAAGGLGAALALVETARSDQGRLERLQRPPHLRVADGVADPRLRAAGRPRRHRGGRSAARPAARRRRGAGRQVQAARSRSTSVTTATMARGRRTSCFPARLMPRSTAPTSTPKGGCSAARKRPSRRARRARIGRSCAPCRELAGQDAAVRQLRPASRSRWSPNIPQLGRDGLIDLPWSPPKLAAKAEGPIRYPIGDFFLTNAICRAQPDDAALLRRAGAGPALRGGGGVTGLLRQPRHGSTAGRGSSPRSSASSSSRCR